MTKQKKPGGKAPVKKTGGQPTSAAKGELKPIGLSRGWSVSTRFSALIAALVCVFALFYVRDYYHAQDVAVLATASTQDVTVEKGDAALIFRPAQGGDIGLIFYPGGKVEHTAYAPLMQQLAQRGVTCVLVEMPFRLAVLDRSAANVYPIDYPEITRWVVGGHSLGGNMAASYAAKNADKLEGLVLLGAYASKDLSESGLPVISVVGELDTVIDKAKYEKSHVNLPKDAEEFTLSGGNHANFGNYGEQEGDGQATITAQQQQEETAQLIASWIASLEEK